MNKDADGRFEALKSHWPCDATAPQGQIQFG
jgi:hypothetical protein